MADSPTGKRRLRAAEREEQIWFDRIHGATLKQAGKRAGVTEARASQVCKERLARINRTCNEDAALRRELCSDELKALRLKLQPKIAAGDLAAIDSARRINESERTLWGLDAPTKSENTGANGGPIVYTLKLPEGLDLVENGQ